MNPTNRDKVISQRHPDNFFPKLRKKKPRPLFAKFDLRVYFPGYKNREGTSARGKSQSPHSGRARPLYLSHSIRPEARWEEEVGSGARDVD